MKHRICIIADALDEHYAGVYTYARELIANLLEIDKENEYTFLHQDPNPFFDGQRQILIPLNRANPLDVFTRKIVRVNAALQQYKFDLVHDLFHIPPFAFRPTASRTVVTIHDLTPILFPQWHPFLRVLTHRLILPRVFRHTTRIIADSTSTAQDIMHRYSHCSPRVTAVPLGTRGLPPPPPHPKEFPFVLFVGTIEPRKNIATIVTAYEELRRRGRPEKLVIIGKPGWRYASDMDRIARSPFSADILLPGFVDVRTLSWYYHNASAFVYPSLYEGFGLPVLEAMHCGCPVIASNTSSIPEVAGDAGLLVSPLDSDALTQQLLTLLSDDSRAREFAARGRQRAQSFTWHNTAEKTLTVYRELL
jgi:glycosyltransferase involved in cell wall biosynthesis